MHLTGRYPDWWKGRIYDRPIRAVAGSESAELTRDGVQRLIVGNPRDESSWGTGLLPKETLANWTRRNGVSDALDGIVVLWGGGGDVQAGHSTLNFKSYDQGRGKWQADTLDVVWLDEEPPMQIYSEALTRVSSTGGMVYATFTPLIGMSEVCRRFLLEPSPDRTLVNMTIDDALHYTPEQRDADRRRIPLARARGAGAWNPHARLRENISRRRGGYRHPRPHLPERPRAHPRHRLRLRSSVRGRGARIRQGW